MYARRVQKDIRGFQNSPPPFANGIYADLPNVYFRITGLPDPYAGGEYIIKIVLPEEYPMMPPKLFVLTESGRFKVNTPICTSFSSYHPESWSPSYDFSSIIISFTSFMLEDWTATSSVGSINANAQIRRKFAAESKDKNAAAGYSAWDWGSVGV